MTHGLKHEACGKKTKIKMKSTNGWILKTTFPPLVSTASASLVASFWGGGQKYLRTYCHV